MNANSKSERQEQKAGGQIAGDGRRTMLTLLLPQAPGPVLSDLSSFA